jgi:hypothetical protein
MNFYPGQRVICIDASRGPCSASGLIACATYVIDEIIEAPWEREPCCTLIGKQLGTMQLGWRLSRFRPLEATHQKRLCAETV